MLHSRRLLILLVICFTVLSLSQIVAQDETPTVSPTETFTLTLQPIETATDVPSETPLPTVTPTPVPTETPTLEPTASETGTETPTLTETATVEPEITLTASPTNEASGTPTSTETVTESVSPTVEETAETTATETATATASATPSAFEPEPPLTLLFTDTFDTGSLILWNLGSGWSLTPYDKGQVLQAVNSDEPVTFVHNTLNNAVVQTAFAMNTGMIRLSLRQSEAGAYTAILAMNGELVLYRSQEVIGTAALAPIEVRTWHNLRLSAINDILRVSVDGIESIVTQDVTPLPAGTFSIAGMGNTNSILLIDEVSLWLPTSDVEPTATPTVEATSVREFPMMPPPPTPSFEKSSFSPFSLDSSGDDVIERRDIDTPEKFMAAIDEANADCAHRYVLYVSPGPYPLSPVNSADYAYEISGKVTIVGNKMYPNKQVNDPTVDDVDKVIFTPGTPGKGVFFLTGTGCGTLTLYNVVISGSGLDPTNSGGAVYSYNNLNIYNSLLKNNDAIGWGGAIYQGGDKLQVINSVFDNNHSVGDYTNTGGGAVATQYNATFDSRCSTYKNNNSRNVGGAFYFFSSSSLITLKHLSNSGNVDTALSNNFEANTATNAWGAFYSIPATDATYQYWDPAPSFVSGNSNSVFGTTFSSALSTPVMSNTDDCIVPPIPLSRDVPDESAGFHLYAQEFGLPMPFETWPVQNYDAVTWKQGYGPSTWARGHARDLNHSPLYEGTHQVHTGIDFSGPPNQIVISVCDGIVVGGESTGFYTGYGIAIQCFADDPTDPDGDGLRNLSNVIVVYNHLNENLEKLGNGFIQSSPTRIYRIVHKGDELGYTSGYYFTNFAVQDESYRYCAFDSDGHVNEPDDCHFLRAGHARTECYDTVGVNECELLATQAPLTPDHLHLEVIIARGGYSHQVGRNAIRFNPLLMFSAQLVTDFITPSQKSKFDTYFPIESVTTAGIAIPFDDQLGLEPYDLNIYSQQGDLGDADRRMNGFFEIQIPEPISTPEWWKNNLGPAPFVGIPRMIDELDNFLFQYGYPESGTPYMGPNCTLIPVENLLEAIRPKAPYGGCQLDWSDRNGQGTSEYQGYSVDDWDPLAPSIWPTSIP